MKNLRIESSALKEIYRSVDMQLRVDAADVENMAGRLGFRLLLAPIIQCVAPPILYLVERVADEKSPQEIVSRHRQSTAFNESWLSK